MVPVLPKILDPEESRTKRLEKQQSRYRHRFGTFVPSERNPLLETLLARGVNGESPPRPKRKTATPSSRTSPRKRKQRSTPLSDDFSDVHEAAKTSTSKPRKSTIRSGQNDDRTSKSSKSGAKSTKMMKTGLLEVTEQENPGTSTNHVKPRAAVPKATSTAAKRRNGKHAIKEVSEPEPEPPAKTKKRKTITRSTTVKTYYKLELAAEEEEEEEEEKEYPKKTTKMLNRTPSSKTIPARDDEDDGKETGSKPKQSASAGDEDSLHTGGKLPIVRLSRAKRNAAEVLEEEQRPGKKDPRGKSKRKPTAEGDHDDEPVAKKVKAARETAKSRKMKADVDQLEQLESLAQLPKAKKRVRVEIKAVTGTPKKAEIEQLEKVTEEINSKPAIAKRSKIFSKLTSKLRNATMLEFPKSNRYSSPLRPVPDEEEDPINFLL